MKKLRDLTLEELGGGMTAIDLGASGGIKPEWAAVAKWTHVIGFDPNVDECARLNRQPTGYRSAQFLPYAIAGETGTQTLHKTKAGQCWSLLQPNQNWLQRFAFADSFAPTGTEDIQVYRLDQVPELAGLDIDAMKVDTQGLELPILESAAAFVDSSIWLETETGMTQNYAGETTFDRVLQFMESRGFGLFGMDTNHPIARRNQLSARARDEQILWCEAVWLRDYYKTPSELLQRLTRPKALRALCLHASHGCLAFGLEAAALFRDLKLITGAEYDALAQDASLWAMPRPAGGWRALLGAGLNWLPRRHLRMLRSDIAHLAASPHPLRRG